MARLDFVKDSIVSMMYAELIVMFMKKKNSMAHRCQHLGRTCLKLSLPCGRRSTFFHKNKKIDVFDSILTVDRESVGFFF